jgi:hypothetical protein
MISMINDKTVEFEVHFREEVISGYMYVEEADDETPLRFYSSTGQEQWYIPSNPYRNPVNNYMMRCESDYDILIEEIATNDIVTMLCDNQDEYGVEIVINTYADVDDVVLIIN